MYRRIKYVNFFSLIVALVVIIGFTVCVSAVSGVIVDYRTFTQIQAQWWRLCYDTHPGPETNVPYCNWGAVAYKKVSETGVWNYYDWKEEHSSISTNPDAIQIDHTSIFGTAVSDTATYPSWPVN